MDGRRFEVFVSYQKLILDSEGENLWKEQSFVHRTQRFDNHWKQSGRRLHLLRIRVESICNIVAVTVFFLPLFKMRTQ